MRVPHTVLAILLVAAGCDAQAPVTTPRSAPTPRAADRGATEGQRDLAAEVRQGRQVRRQEREAGHRAAATRRGDQNYVAPPTLCTGALSARQLGVDRVCVFDNELWVDVGALEVAFERVEVKKGDGRIDVVGFLGRQAWLNAQLPDVGAGPEGVHVKLALTTREVVRREGALAHHYEGALTVFPQFGGREEAAQPSIEEDHLHFYTESDDHEVHWSYAGNDGPEQWGALGEAFEPCFGQAQSPVDLSFVGGDEAQAPKTPVASYEPSRVSLVDNGHTLLASVTGTNSISTEHGSYDLLQFHVHAPSEHTLAGKHFPLEVHLVHAASEGATPALSVIGVFGEVDANCKRRLAGDLVKALPRDTNGRSLRNQPVEFGALVDPAAILPTTHAALNYAGSLTTPPCSETVAWYVMPQPVCFHPDDYKAITDYLGGDNNRPVQGINERPIRETVRR